MVDELGIAEEEVTGINERDANVDGRTRRRKVETMTHAMKRQGERIVSGVVQYFVWGETWEEQKVGLGFW